MSKRKVAENAPRYISGERGEVVLYRSSEGAAALEVRLVRDSLWLSLSEIATLFERDKSVISRHLRNIFRCGELARDAVVAFFATTATDGKTYQVEYFNLDAILSVGYRVNSRRGTQFRIWATGVLRDHLIRGYSVNERRLRELKQSLRLVEQVLDRREVTADEAKALLYLVSDYAYALDLLDAYDHGRVSAASSAGRTEGIAYDEARRIIDSLKHRFGASDLFGRERDQGLGRSLAAILQTFDQRDLYPGREEKAAHLLYFLVKDHNFVDGNKRIAAALFLWFMEKNSMLRRADGARRIADNALVAMTLLIAASDRADRDIICKMIINLINESN
jgi:prophage maintenance system killer protein